jgi:hypothetical protein
MPGSPRQLRLRPAPVALALDEVAAARGVNQRARNQHCDKSPSGSAPPHGLQVAGERGLIGAAKDLAEGGYALKSAALSALARRVWYPCSQYSSPAPAGLLF